MVKARNLLRYVSIFVSTFTISMFTLRLSPFVIYNKSYDSTIYQILGRGLSRGKIPFRDLYDVKGPFLSFIFWVGTLIDSTGFLGDFIILTIILCVGNIYIYKIFAIFTNENRSLLFTCIVTLVLLFTLNTTSSFCAEFIGYPIFMLLFYMFFKASWGQKIGISNYIILGFFIGLIFWIKFQFVFVIFVLLMFIFITKHLFSIKNLLLIVAGFLITTIIVCVFYSINNYLFEMIKDYFLTPFITNSSFSVSNTLLSSLRSLNYLFFYLPLVILTFYALLKINKFLLIPYILTILFNTLGYNVENTKLDYLTFSVHYYFLFGLIFILLEIKKIKKTALAAILIYSVVINIGSLYFSERPLIVGNLLQSDLQVTNSNLDILTEKIKNINTDPNKTILVYSRSTHTIEDEIYRRTDITPSVRCFFIANNWSEDTVSKCKREQDQKIEKDNIKFVIQLDENDYNLFPDDVKGAIYERYSPFSLKLYNQNSIIYYR